MIASMTGFARQVVTLDTGVFDWELKSVNHRYLDLRIRLPEDLSALEPEVRRHLQRFLTRGKIEAVLRERGQVGVAPEAYDLSRVRALVDACSSIAAMMPNPAPVSPLELLRWPGVLEGSGSDSAALAEPLLEGLDRGLQALEAMRAAEGEALVQGMQERLDRLTEQAVRVRERREPTLEEQRHRIRERVGELDLEPDPKRLEQELALLAQKMDIAEELDRIDGHIAAVREILSAAGPCGRRLDFLMQELNRETNTIASKSHDLQITRAAVEMKVLIEQLREQVQNLE
ncbi:MAG: YicC family protein [Thioalkalivibrio sp.]|jgi:uncharacterized protein (TIGR00255 family)|nr:YicC family protein [Thioalkalivibrio sp.]